MSSEQTKRSHSEKLVRCPLHRYGCIDLLPENGIRAHQCTHQHVQVMMQLVESLQRNYDQALIDLTMKPIEIDEPSSKAAITRNNFEQFMARLTSVVTETFHPLNLTETASNTSSPPDQIYDGTASSSRFLIERLDRALNRELNFQSYREQRDLNAAAMDDISHRIVSLSMDDRTNDQMEENQEPSPAPEQTIDHFSSKLPDFLQIDLESQPQSRDGRLSWHIHGILESINGPTSEKSSPINSRSFETAVYRQRLWVRVCLSSSTDSNFISLHVHLNIPFKGHFQGTITLVLVDQSENNPLEHQVKFCAGEIREVNGRLGWDQFIEKNLLRQKGNRYVKNDLVWVLIYVKETTEGAPADYIANVANPLTLLQ